MKAVARARQSLDIMIARTVESCQRTGCQLCPCAKSKKEGVARLTVNMGCGDTRKMPAVVDPRFVDFQTGELDGFLAIRLEAVLKKKLRDVLRIIPLQRCCPSDTDFTKWDGAVKRSTFRECAWTRDPFLKDEDKVLLIGKAAVGFMLYDGFTPTSMDISAGKVCSRDGVEYGILEWQDKMEGLSLFSRERTTEWANGPFTTACKSIAPWILSRKAA